MTLASPRCPERRLASLAKAICDSASPTQSRTSKKHSTASTAGLIKISKQCGKAGIPERNPVDSLILFSFFLRSWFPERLPMAEKKKFRVFATSRIGDAAENYLRERGYELEVFQGPEAPPKKLIIEKVKRGVDGLITTLRDPVDAEVFEAGKGTLKVVAQIAVGFDNINRADANKYKVPFTNTADVLTEATAEFAFFMMGILARKMWQSERLVREQKWPSWHPFLPFLGDEVTGKTIAIIGTGRIGLAMIKKCSGFDMNMRCYDPAFQNHEFIASIQEVMDLRHASAIQREKTWIKYVEFEEALRGADYVTIHVPLLREGETDKPTYHLINEKTLKLMKPTAYLMNSSRGPVVDEKGLAKALKEKVIAGAALDVFDKAPVPARSPLDDPESADSARLF